MTLTLRYSNMQSHSLSIVVVDDHPIIGHGLKSVLGRQKELHIAGVVRSSREAEKIIEGTRPDIIILDITLGEGDGISLITKLKFLSSTSKVIMYTMHRNMAYVTRSFRAGALGYVLKTDKMEELIAAVKTVSMGNVYLSSGLPSTAYNDLISQKEMPADAASALTPREYEVAALISQGKSPDQIGRLLFISPKTVRVHRISIMHKLSCESVHELLLQLRQHFPQE